MSYFCPVCEHQLKATLSGFHCDECEISYPRVAMCPECHQPLLELKACGATDYFCEQGHGLISRSRILWVPETE